MPTNGFFKADDTKAISASMYFSLIITLKKATEKFTKPINDNKVVQLLKGLSSPNKLLTLYLLSPDQCFSFKMMVNYQKQCELMNEFMFYISFELLSENTHTYTSSYTLH